MWIKTKRQKWIKYWTADIAWIKKNMQLYLLYKFRRKLTFEICMYEQISNPNKRSLRNRYSSTEIENHQTLKLYLNSGSRSLSFQSELHRTAFIKMHGYKKKGKINWTADIAWIKENMQLYLSYKSWIGK